MGKTGNVVVLSEKSPRQATFLKPVRGQVFRERYEVSAGLVRAD